MVRRRRAVASKMLLDLNDPRSLKRTMTYLNRLGADVRKIDKVANPALLSELRIRVFGPMLRALRVYPPRKKGMKMRWKNDKQRRKVMMILRWQAKQRGETKDFSYKRSNRLKHGWQYKLTIKQRRILVRIENRALAPTNPYEKTNKRYSKFVVGLTGFGTSHRSLQRYKRPIQPFHTDRGWEPAQQIVQRYVAKAEEVSADYYHDTLERLTKKHGA